MRILSNGVPMSFEEIERYNLPIDKPHEIISGLIGSIANYEEEIVSYEEESERLAGEVIDLKNDFNNEEERADIQTDIADDLRGEISDLEAKLLLAEDRIEELELLNG